MKERLVMKPKHVILFIIIAFWMKLFEIQTDCVIDHPLRLFYAFSMISVLFIAVFFINTQKKASPISRKRIEKQQIIFVLVSGMLVLYFILFGIFLVNPSYQQQTKANMVYNFSFVFFIIVCSSFIGKYRLFGKLVKYLYYSCVVFLIYICIINFDNFQVFNYLEDILVSYNRYSTTYGLYHKNALGNLCLVTLILAFFNYKLCVKKRYLLFKIIYLFLNAIISIMLLSSGSRSSITGFILFVALYGSFSVYERYKSKKSKIFMTLFVVIILFVLLASEVDLISIFTNISNRGLNFSINIPALLLSGRTWIGLGLVNPGLFGTGGLLAETFFLDNYYLYVIMSTGIIGAIIIGIIFIILGNTLFKIRYSILKVLMISMFFTDMYTGLFETCIISALFPSSFIYMILCLSSLYYVNEESI